MMVIMVGKKNLAALQDEPTMWDFATSLVEFPMSALKLMEIKICL